MSKALHNYDNSHIVVILRIHLLTFLAVMIKLQICNLHVYMCKRVFVRIESPITELCPLEHNKQVFVHSYTMLQDCGVNYFYCSYVIGTKLNILSSTLC